MSPRQGLFCVVGIGLIFSFIMGCGGGGGTGGGTPPPPPPTLTLAVNKLSTVINPGVTFSFVVTAEATGTQDVPTIKLGTLTSGLTTSSTFPMTVPASGATIIFTAASSMAPGSYSIPISGSASTATASVSLSVQITAGTPSPSSFFDPSLSNEIELVQGASQTLQFQSNGSSVYDMSLGATGLPTGVTAVFTPEIIEPGDSFSVTLKASASAPIAQNVQWTITGTPGASVPSPSFTLLLDVTPPSGAGWTNQTSYVSTRATPFSAVYDPAHQLIYASNQVWNEIDVISDKTRAELTSISIRDPRGVDISVDGTKVWVATGSQVMYAIDTGTLKATRYQLPRMGANSTSAGISWEGEQVYSLADGTAFLLYSVSTGSAVNSAAIWNPTSNDLTQLTSPSFVGGWGAIARSGDGKRIFSFGGDEGENSFYYDVLTQTFSTPVSLSSFGYAGQAAANGDGSRVAVADANGLSLYDGNLNLIGPLPGDGGLGTVPILNILYGGFVFSPGGQTIYEESEANGVLPVIVTIDVATQQWVALSPGMPVLPIMTGRGLALPAPFAVDSAGMVLGIEFHGIAFDDATVSFNYSPLEPGTPPLMQHMNPYSGPLAGGTTSGGFGNFFSLTPDVYYGAYKGTATVTPDNITITSPPAKTSGPVDVKMLFPDGNEVFDPQFFTYGTQIQDALISGGAPQGGTPANLDAFGLPLDPSQNVVTVGGNTATVTSTVTQYPPFTGEQTDLFLSFTAPSGSPGWQDIKVTNPNGTGTLSKAFLYAKSVEDYPTTDSPTFVLYDNTRNQVYLSAGNHIDVFSMSSLSFSTPLNSPVTGSQFQGLALTPNGKYLLATDLSNLAVAVIDPDSPSGSYEIALPGSTSTYGQCSVGPLFVVADNQGNALVTSGAVVGLACGPFSSPIFAANIALKTSTRLNAANCGSNFGAMSLGASRDGSLIGMTGGLNIYLPAQQACIPVAATNQSYLVAVSGDGNVLGFDRAFADTAGNIVGHFAYPPVFYPNATSSVYYNYDPYFYDANYPGALQNARLNDAGSLYYWAYPGYVDVVDVQHGISTLRFGLTEAVTNTVAPLAIDSSGQRIFLITNKGLTVVDLGNAPLSIGHLSQQSASAGTQIVIRGSGFQNGISATVGGVSASVTFTDSETLTLTLPSAGTGIQDLVLTNPDSTSYTLQNALTVQ